MLRLPYRTISLEITRRCNMQCAHCLRGEAQEQIMTRQVIDRFLEETGTVQHLLLTGGEICLAPGTIKYLVDEIIRRKSRILTFSCVTNGSICDRSIINNFNRLSRYIATEFKELYTEKGLKNIGIISISNDGYHSGTDLDKTASFYRKYANKHMAVFKESRKKYKSLVASGNAIKNNLVNDNDLEIIYHICPYRLTIKDDMVYNDIEITPGGGVTFGGDYSYQKIDSQIFGNILNGHLSDIFLNNCHHQMFTYEEAASYDYFYSSLKTKKFVAGWTEKDYIQMLGYFDSVYEKRVKLTFLFPFLKYEEIVKLAYDILNLAIRKSDNDNKIFYIDSFDRYNHSLKESLEYYNKIKKQAIKKDPVNFFKTYWKVAAMNVDKISEKYQVI